jgi:peptidoglycan/xylan/chitin deacetylase (PgdA/CDA1 family)
MRLYRPCFFTGWFYPEALFRIKTTEKLLSLTFDDGPDPGSTAELIDILKKSDVKAMFFCKGRAAEKYPGLVDLIKSNGHLIGNHGYNHLDGWRSSVTEYVADIDYGSRFTSSSLFRPPYGRLKPGQYRKLKRTYKIFFWDIMPYDFDKSMRPGESLDVLLQKIRCGSVIVLHDQPLSSLIPLLPRFIETAIQRGYRFVIPDSSI